jgi:7-cyano-7-deazaguanine synthase
MDAPPKKAVILLSGGLDSSTTLAIAKSEGFDLYALSFRYGQRHAGEVGAAAKVARSMDVKRHVILDIGLGIFGGSALTGNIDVPKRKDASDITKEIPVTYVPARNTIFLSFALAFAESIDARDIFIGVNAIDYSGYPDCRPEFIEAFERLANLATKAGVEGRSFTIHAPLISLTKSQIIRAGTALGVDYSLTATCYDPSPDGKSCGSCEACLLRLQGFREAGLKDPVDYAR